MTLTIYTKKSSIRLYLITDCHITSISSPNDTLCYTTDGRVEYMPIEGINFYLVTP